MNYLIRSTNLAENSLGKKRGIALIKNVFDLQVLFTESSIHSRVHDNIYIILPSGLGRSTYDGLTAVAYSHRLRLCTIANTANSLNNQRVTLAERVNDHDSLEPIAHSGIFDFGA